METAEVESDCAGVLALTLPAELSGSPDSSITSGPSIRTALPPKTVIGRRCIRENASRSRLLAESLSYADFIAGLELEVEIRELQGAEEITRAAQMTQRTNQFNFTTQRFTVPRFGRSSSAARREILTHLCAIALEITARWDWSCMRSEDDALQVNNLLLSCRVLGKGVEHAMVARLGQMAAARSLSAIEFDYRPTPKNTPARDFLRSLGADRLPAGMAAAVRFSVPQNELPAEQSAAAPIPELPVLRSTLHGSPHTAAMPPRFSKR